MNVACQVLALVDDICGFIILLMFYRDNFPSFCYIATDIVPYRYRIEVIEMTTKSIARANLQVLWPGT